MYTYSFYRLEEYSNQSQIMYLFQKLLIILALVLGFLFYGTLYKYSLIIKYDLISFPCTNLRSYLSIIFQILFVFYIHNSFFTVPIVILMTCYISTLLVLWNTERMNDISTQHNVGLHWVPGQAGVQENENANKLA